MVIKMSKQYAKIKKDASTLFTREQRKTYRNVPLPREAQRFRELLRKLAGKTFEIDRIYNDRIVLNYPVKIVDGRGCIVTGIDLAINLVELL